MRFKLSITQTRVPSRKEFEQMAAQGRLHRDDHFIPSDSDLDNAQSPLELGRLYGFGRRYCALLHLQLA